MPKFHVQDGSSSIRVNIAWVKRLSRGSRLQVTYQMSGYRWQNCPYQMSGYREAELPPTRCLATGRQNCHLPDVWLQVAELPPTRCLATGRQN